MEMKISPLPPPPPHPWLHHPPSQSLATNQASPSLLPLNFSHPSTPQPSTPLSFVSLPSSSTISLNVGLG
ncbi:hypothetical protein ACSBR2_011774 [Camellia fascicularis]